MIVKGTKDYTIVKNGIVSINVSNIFKDGDDVEVVVLENCDKGMDPIISEKPITHQIVLKIDDSIYEHIMYFLRNLPKDEVEIIEDIFYEKID